MSKRYILKSYVTTLILTLLLTQSVLIVFCNSPLSLNGNLGKPIRNLNPHFVNSINVEWNLVPSLIETHYRIRVTDIMDNTLFTYDTENHSHLLLAPNVMNISNLILGKFYKFYVTAYNVNGESSESDPLIAQECLKPKYLLSNSVRHIMTEFNNSLTSLKISIKSPTLLGGCEISKYVIHHSLPGSSTLTETIDVFLFDNYQKTIVINPILDSGKLINIKVEAINPSGSSYSEEIYMISLSIIIIVMIILSLYILITHIHQLD